ncbi:hypothetical protein PsorP6_011510 [Peronosclerospora sorghi]|uniref:Uncharacterized protein n=1 Tax=Peronosclerospora sorghi TaxID=230839 RepID=A0ACC0WJJ2_9STRA|nr:hypothetical protein PsorP6_011510 [Peronosclerospora sorghi]
MDSPAQQNANSFYLLNLLQVGKELFAGRRKDAATSGCVAHVGVLTVAVTLRFLHFRIHSHARRTCFLLLVASVNVHVVVEIKEIPNIPKVHLICVRSAANDPLVVGKL